MNTTGNVVELDGTIPVLLPASGALGYQAGLNYGQPVSGTTITGITETLVSDPESGSTTVTGITEQFIMGTPYLTNTLAESWYSPRSEGVINQRWRVVEDSHITYQMRIRSGLIFT